MLGSRTVALFAVSALAVSLSAGQTPVRMSAQEPSHASPPQTPQHSNDVATAPDQLRHVPPPAADATPADLETKADELRSEKSYPDAIDYYRAAIKKQPSAERYTKMGFAELQMLHYDVAKHDFEKAIKLDPAYAVAYNDLGVILYVKKNYSKAIKRYQDAIRLEEETASFHSNLGTAYFARNEYDKASQQYLRAMEIEPDIFTRPSSHGGFNMHMANKEDRAHYSYVIAKMFAAKGDNDRCLLYLRRAIEDGYPVARDIYKETEFSNIRKDPRFQEMMAAKIVSIPN